MSGPNWRVSTDGVRGCVEGPRGRICTDIVLTEDAHLIAAAPDLYSALVEILDASNIAELPTREESERLDRAEEAARAAIKKARGGE